MIFDFDHTLIEENSDIVRFDLLKNQTKRNELMNKFHSNLRWTDHMNDVFEELWNERCAQLEIESALMAMKYVEGMEDNLTRYRDAFL